jgi:hypothetical protein
MALPCRVTRKTSSSGARIIDEEQTKRKGGHQPSSQKLVVALCFLLLFCASFGLTTIEGVWMSKVFCSPGTAYSNESFASSPSSAARAAAGKSGSNCPQVQNKNTESFGNGTIASSNKKNTSIWNVTIASDYSHLLNMLLEERRNVNTHLETDYGPYYRDLFYHESSETNISRGKLVAYDSSHPHGWESLIRRLQVKILTVQEQVLQEEEERIQQLKQKKQMSSILSKFWRQRNTNNKESPLTTKPTVSCPSYQEEVRWVFAVSGHSSSAGHGNFDSQSYASVMEHALSSLFDSFGLTLETRNYGMSAKKSAPELALCQEAIFGTDVDVLTWDSALTDRGIRVNFEYWTHRAASSIRNRPVLLAAHIPVSQYKNDQTLKRIWEQNGPYLPLIVMNDTVVAEMEAAVPDSLQTTDLPPLLKFLKCGNGDIGDDFGYLEVNDPCKMEKLKFDTSICPDRYWMASWHPGYRRLALYGNLLALMHADAIEEAVRELIVYISSTKAEDSSQPLSSKVTLRQVQQLKSMLEEQEREASRRQTSTRSQTPAIGGVESPELIPGVPPSWHLQSPSICRTARLPSQQRYKGILAGRGVRYSESEAGFPVPVDGREHEWIVQSANKTIPNPNSTAVLDFSLGYDEKARASQRACNQTMTNQDFSDYFYVTDREWRRAILPSPAELEEYGRQNELQNETSSYHGLLFVCPLFCKFQSNVCSGDEFSGDWSRLEFKVNGAEARAQANFINQDCVLLSHLNDNDELPLVFVFPPREDGTWELQVRIRAAEEEDAMKIFQINSIVLI